MDRGPPAAALSSPKNLALRLPQVRRGHFHEALRAVYPALVAGDEDHQPSEVEVVLLPQRVRQDVADGLAAGQLLERRRVETRRLGTDVADLGEPLDPARGGLRPGQPFDGALVGLRRRRRNQPARAASQNDASRRRTAMERLTSFDASARRLELAKGGLS